MSRASRGARKLWPLVLMGWRRWQALPPEHRERYKRQARGYADRGRKALAARGRKRKR